MARDAPPDRHPRRARRWMLRVLVWLATAYLTLVAIAALFAERMLFLPHPPDQDDPARFVVRETAAGERIALRWLANPEARAVLLYHHGNAEDLYDIERRLRLLRDCGYAVCAYDYPGYGASSGTPSVAGVRRAAATAYAYLVEERGVAPGRIVSHGRSLGGGPATWIAHREPVGGLVLESAFTSVFRVATRVRLLPWDLFDNLALVDEVDCPVLVIHSVDDRAIPVAHGRALFAAAREPKRALWLEGVGHNETVVAGGEAYLDALRAFAEVVGGDAPP